MRRAPLSGDAGDGPVGAFGGPGAGAHRAHGVHLARAGAVALSVRLVCSTRQGVQRGAQQLFGLR